MKSTQPRLLAFVVATSLWQATACSTPTAGGGTTLPGGAGSLADSAGRATDAGGAGDASGGVETAAMIDAGADLPGPSCPGGAGCTCASNAECDVDLCIDTQQGKECARTCVSSCPTGLTCSQVTGGGGDTLSVCVPQWGWRCDPCVDSAACQALGHSDARCVRYGGNGSFCGTACKIDNDCGDGFGCKAVQTFEGQSAQQCVRLGVNTETFGICPCSKRAVDKGLSTACQQSFDAPEGGGLVDCPGFRACESTGAEGLGACTAKPPLAEICDGVDNDCDSKVDEATCDDDNSCTIDACDPVGGGGDGCSHKSDDGKPCDDGNKCSVDDTCKAGQCAGGASVCVCQSDADCGSAEDGNLCNGTPHCATDSMPYKCVIDPKTVVKCSPSGAGPCLVTACQPADGKCADVPVEDGKICDDGNACTAGDHCVAGKCTSGTLICGCQSDADCAKQDDDNLCNGQLKCNTDKVPYACQIDAKTVITCASDGDTDCAVNTCDPKTGVCAAKAAADGKSCDDGDPCTVGDTCKASKCSAGASLCTCKQTADCGNFEDNNLCNGTLICDTSVLPYKCATDAKTVIACAKDGDTTCAFNACNPKTGGCAPVAVQDGVGCDDGSACTKPDQCKAGKCGGAPVSCDDGLPCTADSCEAKAGCKHVNTTSGCDDGNDCTLDDVCKASKCISGPPPSCSDKQLNGKETDTDCGGLVGACGLPACMPCLPGGKCKAHGDCDSKVCLNDKCAKATCSDKVKNGDEAGVDCGGSCDMCPRLILVAAGGAVFGAVKEQGGVWQVDKLSGVTIEGLALTVVGGKQVVAVMRYTKMYDKQDNALLFAAWQAGKWQDFLPVGNDVVSRGQPTLAALNGIAHLGYIGMDYKHYVLQRGAGAWNSPQALGKPHAYGPSAPALATAGGALIGGWIDGASGNKLAINQLGAGGWSAPQFVGDKTEIGVAPTLLGPGAGLQALAIWVRFDGQVMASPMAGGKWLTAEVIKDAWSKNRVAATATSDGQIQIAFRGMDGKLYSARRSGGKWLAPSGVGSSAPTVATSPTLSRGIDGKEVEIGWVDGGGAVWHGRLAKGAWSQPIQVGKGGTHVALVTGP